MYSLYNQLWATWSVPLNVYSPSAIIGLSLFNSILIARFLIQSLASTCPKGTTIVNCSNSIIEMHPRVVLRRENVPRGPEVVNRSLKADCTDFTKFESSDLKDKGVKAWRWKTPPFTVLHQPTERWIRLSKKTSSTGPGGPFFQLMSLSPGSIYQLKELPTTSCWRRLLA